jgi:hypothetical protein
MSLYAGSTTGGSTGPPTNPIVTYAATIVRLQPATTAAKVTQQTATRTAASQVKDTSGTTLVANDASGFGLKRPYLDWNVYKTAEEAAPTATTSSGTFVSLLTLSSEPQHPRLRVRVRAVTGAATSGQVQLVDRATGQVIAGPLVVGLNTAVEANLEGALVTPSLSGAGAPMRVDVQAKITAGASTIGVLVMHAIGVGT